MTYSTTLLDPTDERMPAMRQAVSRPTSLDGLRVGLLDISKPRGDVFLDRIANRLEDQGLDVKRFSKPAYTKVAPVALRQEISSQCDVVIEGLAD